MERKGALPKPDKTDDERSPNEELKKKGIYYITGMIEEGDLLEIHQDILIKHLDPKWKDDIQLVINSAGGETMEGWALIDLLDWVRMDVRTVGMGECSSVAANLLASGTTGKRTAAPNCTIMIHGNWTDGFVKGTRHEMIAQMKWVEQEHRRDLEFWKKHSKYTTDEEIADHLLQKVDVYMTPETALEHGIVDNIAGSEVPKQKRTRKTAKKT